MQVTNVTHAPGHRAMQLELYRIITVYPYRGVVCNKTGWIIYLPALGLHLLYVFGYVFVFVPSKSKLRKRAGL